MGENKKYFWLKLYNDFFSSKRIKRLRSLAGGDTYTIIYLKMQLKALKDDGYLYFDGVMDEFAEELSTNLETFASVFKRQMSTIRLIKEYRYYVDPKAFPDVKPRAYENFAKDLTKLCKTYGVTIKCIGGVSLHSQDEMKKLLGYSSDLDSGDILPIWRD